MVKPVSLSEKMPQTKNDWHKSGIQFVLTLTLEVTELSQSTSSVTVVMGRWEVAACSLRCTSACFRNRGWESPIKKLYNFVYNRTLWYQGCKTQLKNHCPPGKGLSSILILTQVLVKKQNSSPREPVTTYHKHAHTQETQIFHLLNRV